MLRFLKLEIYLCTTLVVQRKKLKGGQRERYLTLDFETQSLRGNNMEYYDASLRPLYSSTISLINIMSISRDQLITPILFNRLQMGIMSTQAKSNKKK